MEDAGGYMTLQTSRQNVCPALPPSKTQKQGFSKGCKIILGILLALSIAVNAALITLQLVFQEKDTSPSTIKNSCELIPGISADSVTFDPDTAHPRIAVSRDGKTVQMRKEKLTDISLTLAKEVWILGQNGFLSGKHCWEVEIKGDGEWAVGVAKESVKRKEVSNHSIHEGIWGIGEYRGKANYVAFTDPHTKLYFDKKPRRIRVFLDYNNTQVELFNAETQISIYTFNSAAFSGEKIFPWFDIWIGTELKLHP